MWTQTKYQRALEFAALAHRDQTAPQGRTPFVTLPCLVAMEVMSALAAERHLVRDDDLAVQCALLHWVLDQGVRDLGELNARFGVNVAEGVAALTPAGPEPQDDPRFARRWARATDCLERVLTQPSEVWMVGLAARIVELGQPPASWTPARVDYHRQESLEVWRYLKSSSPYLSGRLQAKITSFP